MAAKSYWDRFQRQRMTRRRLLATTGVGATGLAIAAACGGGGGDDEPSPDGTSAPSGDIRRGGRYVYSITGDWGTIDPVTSVSFGPGIFPRIYNALLDRSRIQADFFYFDLAEELEQPDDETYVFNLRSNVTIAPNSLGIEERALDSSDVVAWMDRITGDDNAVLRAFTNMWLQSHEASSPTQFTMKTNGPYAYTLFRIGAPLGGCIPPKEFFEQDMSLEGQGAGGGPFGSIVSGSYSNTGGIVVTANPNYYRTDDNGDMLPYLAEVEAVRISDRQPRRAAFIDRQIHTYAAEERTEADELEGMIPGVLVEEEPANTFISFTMHPEKEPWTDERIRMAALHALDRQQFVDRVVGEGGGRPNGLVHWPLGDFALPPEELEELQSFNPEMSRALIREATGNDTISINVIYPVSDIEFHDKHLPIFLQQMEAAGFEVNGEAQDFTTWLTNYQTLNYDASLALNQIYETAEIPIDFHAADGPQGDRNFAVGIGGLYPEIEEAIQESKRIIDAEEQIEAVRNVQRMLYERGPAFLPIMSWTAFTLYHPFVQNVPTGIGATGLYLTNQIWLDL